MTLHLLLMFVLFFSIIPLLAIVIGLVAMMIIIRYGDPD